MSYIDLARAQELATSMGIDPNVFNQGVLDMAHGAVIVKMYDMKCTPPASADDDGILELAEYFLALEFLAKAGKVTVTSGEIARQTQGRVSVEMQKWYPMFFFGGQDTSVRGDSIGSMMMHMSYWQLGNYFITKYCEKDYSVSDVVSLVDDNTTRGDSWNVPYTT